MCALFVGRYDITDSNFGWFVVDEMSDSSSWADEWWVGRSGEVAAAVAAGDAVCSCVAAIAMASRLTTTGRISSSSSNFGAD